MTQVANPGWRGKLSFLDNQFETSKVAGADVRFFPVSLGVMIELREPAKLFGRALAVLFHSTANDAGSKQITDTKEGINEVTVEAIKPELAVMRLAAKQQAVSDIVDALAKPEHLAALGRLIMDSLRDQFPRGSRENPPPLEFMQNIDAPVITEFLIGVAKANKGLFGPLGLKAGEILGGISKAVNEKIKATIAEPPVEQPAAASPAPQPIPFNPTAPPPPA